MAGEALLDLDKPIDQTWTQFTVFVMEDALACQRPVLFDLTYVVEISGVLDGNSAYAETVTGFELRYLRTHWGRFQAVVRFYEDGREKTAPW